jgi:glycosyltransferase involved in cell wall biosynthesis
MNILFLGPLPDPVTGHSLACKVLLDELVKRHTVTVINLSKPELTSGLTSGSQVLRVLGTLRRVWRDRNRADVIYLTIAESVAGNLKDLAIYLICRRQLGRLVVHLHGGSLRQWIFDKHPILRRLNKYFLSRAGAVIVLGHSLVGIFRDVVPEHRIRVVPNFAEDYLFASREQIEQKFQCTSPLRIFFLSNLIEGKGHQEMVDAYLSLPPAKQERLRIDFAGAFESPAVEERFKRATAATPNIRHHGIVSGAEKQRLLQAAHVLCLPTSLMEGQPISILEAYAAGCVVIATLRGGIKDIFVAGENGFEIAHPTVEGLRMAFESLLDRMDELPAFALHNAAVAQANYRTFRYTSDLLRIIDDVATREMRIAKSENMWSGREL